MERTTRKQAEAVFGHLLNAMGRYPAQSYNHVGGLRIDYNPTYGGAVIEEILNAGGGVNHPFGDRRMPLGEFVQAMHFAINVLRNTKR